MKTKICCKCKKRKLLSEFYKAKRHKDGYTYNCKSCRKKYQQSKAGRVCHRKSVLKFKYGLSPKGWQQMYDEQQGCCVICGRHQSKLSQTLSVHHLIVDGNKLIIALLCGSCNRGIGLFNHSIELLEKAIKFIKEKHLKLG